MTTPAEKATAKDVRYQFVIRWTTRSGYSETGVWADSLEESERLGWEIVKRMGWTPPRLWQWWRWKDTTPRLQGGTGE